MKKGSTSEADLRLLDDYRRSFRQPYDLVIQTIKKRLNLEPTGRPAKSTISIVAKLRRESIRLSQVQDIAGCRLVVANVRAQERAIQSLRQAFLDTAIADRRANPSHGYRAVHVIAKISEKSVEIQVRTTLQHLWSDFSEGLSDRVDPNIKYGGGDREIGQALSQTSEMVAEFEELEQESKPGLLRSRLRRNRMIEIKRRITEHLEQLIFLTEKLR